MSSVQTFVPPQYASQHVLVVPESLGPAHLRDLADAWFPDPHWLTEPQIASGPGRMAGARFRGLTAPPQQAVPGLLGIDEEHGVAGPFPVDATAAQSIGVHGAAAAYALGRLDGMLDARGARPAVYDDRDGIARAFPAALPEGTELRLVQWGVAVARKAAGVLLADGRQRLAPDPTGAVDLTLYCAHPVASTELLALLRTIVATADIEPGAATAGATSFRLVARTPYDGVVTVEAQQVERVPRALAGLDWREYGPYSYRVSWAPQDPYELQVEQPSDVHVIARARMRAIAARFTLLLRTSVGGSVVDDGAFLVTSAELEQRTDEQRRAARAWI